jgi:hypothetical protein
LKWFVGILDRTGVRIMVHHSLMPVKLSVLEDRGKFLSSATCSSLSRDFASMVMRTKRPAVPDRHLHLKVEIWHLR